MPRKPTGRPRGRPRKSLPPISDGALESLTGTLHPFLRPSRNNPTSAEVLQTVTTFTSCSVAQVAAHITGMGPLDVPMAIVRRVHQTLLRLRDARLIDYQDACIRHLAPALAAGHRPEYRATRAGLLHARNSAGRIEGRILLNMDCDTWVDEQALLMFPIFAGKRRSDGATILRRLASMGLLEARSLFDSRECWVAYPTKKGWRSARVDDRPRPRFDQIQHHLLTVEAAFVHAQGMGKGTRVTSLVGDETLRSAARAHEERRRKRGREAPLAWKKARLAIVRQGRSVEALPDAYATFLTTSGVESEVTIEVITSKYTDLKIVRKAIHLDEKTVWAVPTFELRERVKRLIGVSPLVLSPYPDQTPTDQSPSARYPLEELRALETSLTPIQILPPGLRLPAAQTPAASRKPAAPVGGPRKPEDAAAKAAREARIAASLRELGDTLKRNKSKKPSKTFFNPYDDGR